MGLRSKKVKLAAKNVLKLVAYGAVIHFIATETAENIGHFLGHGGSAEPLPDLRATAWRDWFEFVSTSSGARMVTATAALCYLGNDIDKWFTRIPPKETDNPARQGVFGRGVARLRSAQVQVVSPSTLKLLAAGTVATVIAHQIGITADNVMTEYKEMMANPALAAAKAPKNFDEWVEHFTGPFSMGSLVASIAFHYFYKDLSAAPKAAARSALRKLFGLGPACGDRIDEGIEHVHASPGPG